MATKVQTLLLDDIDGGDAAETVSFSLDGVAYEIDLNADHADQLRATIGTFVEHARRIKGVKGQPRPQRTATTPPVQPKANGINGKHSSREIRDWARTQGLDVPATGRVPNAVIEAFEAAH